MKIGDIVQIKNAAFYSAGYNSYLFDEKMLVTGIITRTANQEHDPVVEVVSESGTHGFPMEDLEVVPEVLEREIMIMALALAE